MSRATRFIDACRGRPTDCTPVWLMRQAGRYQPSYQAVRAEVSFFELCSTPDLAAQVTVAAVEEMGVDAAIIFSDILVPLLAMGAQIEMTRGGPKLEPLRDRAAVDKLRVVEPAEEVPYVMEAIRETNRRLDGLVPLIGFVGAPLTLASYLVEGGGSKSCPHLKGMLFSDGEAAHQLLEKLTTVVTRHLRAQVEAGAHAVQVFESWASVLAPHDYRAIALPYLKRIFSELSDLDVPTILFAQGTTTLLDELSEAGADVLSVDWSTDLAVVRERLPNTPLQGNLDPTYLFMDEDELQERIAHVLERAGAQDGKPAPGHVFNLGHGILPPTKTERVQFLVKTVHRLTGGESEG
ncbi:MAG: uroporphyrinogen decarboxylase [Proteobacteria bacterium]|nr:MAG: uroporphyrinogen decarboxylase [Pseudomonadota bacterium]PIE18723.1 MAG: uroporphyrinogen decarboxylase [Pseudomonadota bacterium]